MFDVDIWQEIFSTIKKNKLRTFLTGFSVAWGIFMLMVLLGSGNGLSNGVKQEFAENAINVMWMWTGETSIPYNGLKEGRPIKFNNRDYEFLTTKSKEVEKVSSRYYLPNDILYAYGKEYGSFETSTCYPVLMEVENITMNTGRFINDLDIQEFRKVVVIGIEIRKALFKEEDPIGKYIRIGGVPFNVIGVTNEKKRNQDNNRQAYMPFSTAQRIFNGGDRVHMFTVTSKMVQTTEEADSVTQKIRSDMAQRHAFDPKDKKAMGSFNMLTQYIRTMKIFQAINLFVWIIGIGTLIAGIVGVSNIMLILVKERTREIGIRKALGATPLSVIGLVLLESVLITTVAGYIGLVLGVGLMELVNFGLEQATGAGAAENVFFRNPTVDFKTAVSATLILILSGALAGYFPSRRAANVTPIEALRDEN
jgi:putative ABC transport system permease protein